MMDFSLRDHDLAIEHGDVRLCASDTDAIAQAIIMRLKTFAGEWFLDSNVGLPYLTHMLGKKNSERFLRRIVTEAIKSLPGVMELRDFACELDHTKRSMHIRLSAILSDQRSITVNEPIGV